MDPSSFGIPASVYHRLNSTTQRIIDRFSQHKAEKVDLSMFPQSKHAAVLILLYEQNDQIFVLLTTRSKTLRSHPGQTALPGGKYDEEDGDLLKTALREAHEEVSLPLVCSSIYTLCKLRPFLSLHRLVVVPVVSFLSEPTLIKSLKPSSGEVERIFSHPLDAILEPETSSNLSLVPKGSEHWPYHTEYHDTTDAHWINGTPYRMHRFRSTASPIKGLTADILIMAAEIAFARDPAYSRWAPGQPGTFAEIVCILNDCDERKDVAVAENSQVAG